MVVITIFGQNFLHLFVYNKISSERVIGIAKRIATVSLQLPPGPALGLMATLRQFIQVHTGCVCVCVCVCVVPIKLKQI